MSAVRDRRRTIVRRGVDVLLLAAAALLVTASGHELGRKVDAIHRWQLDMRTFWRWARLQPTGKLSPARVVARAPAADVVCARRLRPPVRPRGPERRRGRICAAIRRGPAGARVIAGAYVAPGHHVLRHGRLAAPRPP